MDDFFLDDSIEPFLWTKYMKNTVTRGAFLSIVIYVFWQLRNLKFDYNFLKYWTSEPENYEPDFSKP